MSGRLRRRVKKDPGELNITAFLNLMVILVPFLLITAVFSRMAVLELNIPPGSLLDQPEDQKKDLQLVVTIRRNAIEVGDSVGGLIKRIAASPTGHDLKALSQLLVQVKTRFPDKKNCAILAEPDVSYETLVHVMDTVRVVEQLQGTSVVKAELFPDISIGDAPREGALNQP
jgi:biopolymer transport protein ExbD